MTTTLRPQVDIAGIRRQLFPNIRTRQHAVSFNTFCHSAPVTWEREAFHSYVHSECGLDGDLSPDTWWDLWEGFTRRQDAAAERETMADAVGASVQ
jgi:hypothetical protein